MSSVWTQRVSVVRSLINYHHQKFLGNKRSHHERKVQFFWSLLKGEGGFQWGAHWAPTYGDWYCTTYHDFMLEIRSQIPILPRMSSPNARFKPNLKFVCQFLRSKFNNGKAVNSYQWKLFKPLQLSFDVVSRQRVPFHHGVVAVPLPFVK